MPTFKKYNPQSEKELHGFIEKELDSLEEGLDLLKYEIAIGKGIPDFLCRDSGGRIVIIEVKLYEDENILFQALRYYADVNKNRYAIAEIFSQKGIDARQDPRIVLIAKRFSDDIRLLGTLVVPNVELYEYEILYDSNDQKGIIYHAVSLPKVDTLISEPTVIDNHKFYITNEDLHIIFDEVRNKIKQQGDGIEEYVTQSYIGYKYRGRQIAWISAQRKSFDIGVNIISEKRESIDYESIRVTSGNEIISELLSKIKDSYQNLKG